MPLHRRTTYSCSHILNGLPDFFFFFLFSFLPGLHSVLDSSSHHPPLFLSNPSPLPNGSTHKAAIFLSFLSFFSSPPPPPIPSSGHDVSASIRPKCNFKPLGMSNTTLFSIERQFHPTWSLLYDSSLVSYVIFF